MRKTLFITALAATILPFALAQNAPATPAAPTTPAQQTAPAQQPATPAEPQQATPADQSTQPAPVSYLTSITFPRPAVRPAGTEGNKAVSESMAGLSSVVRDMVGPNNYCGTGEVVFWELQDQQEGVDTVGGVNARMRAFGYTLELVDSGNYGATAVVVFTATSPRMNVFGVWGLQPGGLSLAWCRLEGKLK